MIDGSLRTVVCTSLPSCLLSESRMRFSSASSAGHRGGDLDAHDAGCLVCAGRRNGRGSRGRCPTRRRSMSSRARLRASGEAPSSSCMPSRTRSARLVLGFASASLTAAIAERLDDGRELLTPAGDVTRLLGEREVRLGVAAGEDACAYHVSSCRAFAAAAGCPRPSCNASSMRRWCALASIASPSTTWVAATTRLAHLRAQVLDGTVAFGGDLAAGPLDQRLGVRPRLGEDLRRIRRRLTGVRG